MRKKNNLLSVFLLMTHGARGDPERMYRREDIGGWWEVCRRVRCQQREIPPMLNQLQHRLNCLIISVMTEQIQDSLAFTVFSQNMPRDLLRGCLYVGAADWVAEYSRDKPLTWEHSQG